MFLGNCRGLQACAKFRLRLSSRLRLGVGLVLALEYALDYGLWVCGLFSPCVWFVLTKEAVE